MITESILKANSVINRYSAPYCSISGGRDSDIMLDLLSKVDKDNRLRYVWFDTGIEYQATKDHLQYLENKYGIDIERINAIKPIPISCKEYGQPFLSKYVSEHINRLQIHNFNWEDESYESLILKYPRCISSISWWTNHYNANRAGFSRFNINFNNYLKEFIIENPPQFKISNKCCTYAKKNVGKKYIKENGCNLSIIGIRKSEGGARAGAYSSCFDPNNDADKNDIAYYRPLFWYKNEDEEQYDDLFGIKHSDCYGVYGLVRTGCVGCPYNRKIDEELKVIEMYEPKLLKAVNNVFQDSYEYTKQYHEFCERYKTKIN